MADVQFQDFSFEVKAALDQETKAWLNEWANEIASHAKDNCKMEFDAGVQLRKSYRADVDEEKGEAQIGSDLESAYWEEFGTGSHADLSKNGGIPGRTDWWVYNKDTPRAIYEIHRTESVAKAEAAARTALTGEPHYASDGREPQYTLETAFTVNKPKAIRDLEIRLGRKLD